MEFENPQVDHSVNSTQEHPLKEFSQLLIGVGVLCVITVLIIGWFSETLVKRIPFSYEQSMAEDFTLVNTEQSPTADQLQALADRLIPHMDLPSDMSVKVHHSLDGTVNAFATLGGNVVFFDGLLNAVESEDELAAVMAHEIAHIKLRHPIAAMGKGVGIATLAVFVSGFSGSSAGEWLLGSSAQLSFMHYSREQELAADALAAQAIAAEYGHIGGARALFARFSELEAARFTTDVTPDLLRSHPHSDQRWLELQKRARNHGWPIDGELLPKKIRSN